MKMHTSSFYKNHNKFLSVEEFCFIVNLHFETTNKNYDIALTPKVKQIINGLEEKGYIKNNSIVEIDSDIRFFKIEEELYYVLKDLLTETELYMYYLIQSLKSQGETVSAGKIANMLKVKESNVDIITDRLTEEYLIEK
ncbi:MAG TPA: hypothetical protein DEB42_00470 [Jeotgalicoccus sp.]|nr:hypothetical protein [Jeotgalicoccus sp.]